MTLEMPAPQARPRRARPRHAVVRFSGRPVARLGVRAFSARRRRVPGARSRGAAAARRPRRRTTRTASRATATPISPGCAAISAGDPLQRVAWKAVARGARLAHQAVRGRRQRRTRGARLAARCPRARRRSANRAARRVGARRGARRARRSHCRARNRAACGPGPRASARRAHARSRCCPRSAGDP